MSRKSSKKYQRKHYIKKGHEIDYYLKDLRKLENEIHRSQKFKKNIKEGDEKQ